MKKIPEILYLARARNAEHYHLQEALLKAVTEDFATKYKLTSLRKNYVDLFKEEDAVYLQTLGYADTAELSAKDAVRDKYFRFVRLTIESKQLSLDDKEVSAANKLAFIMKPYTLAASKPDAENTAMVSDLVKKLQSDEYAPYVKTMGLTDAVTALKTANDDFDEVYSHRAGEKKTKAVTDNLLKIRPRVDAAFLKLSEAINALYLVSEVIENDTEKTTEIGVVIDAVNAEILQFSETLSRRGAGAKAKIEPDDHPIIDPDEGGDHPVIE